MSKEGTFYFLLGLQIAPSGSRESRVQTVYWPNSCPVHKTETVKGYKRSDCDAVVLKGRNARRQTPPIGPAAESLSRCLAMSGFGRLENGPKLPLVWRRRLQKRDILIHHPIPRANLLSGYPRLGKAERLSPSLGGKHRGKRPREKRQQISPKPNISASSV